MNNFNVGVLEPSVLGYIWEVKDCLTNSASVGDRFISSVFSTKHADTTVKWRLWLYPKSNQENNQNYLSIYLEYIGEGSVTVQAAFNILNIEDQSIHKLMKRRRLFKTGSNSGFSQFVKRDFILDKNNHALKNDTLRILCEIDFNSTSIFGVSSSIENENVTEKEYKESNYRLQEFDDFEKLLESEAFSDITFVVEEKKIHAHKAILVSRSPVFQVMLQCYTKESQDNTLEISGMKYEVMKELLRFMYVGRVNDIDKQATELLKAADKYSVAGLKAMCETVLYKSLTIDNALEYLNLAAMCDAIMMKSRVIEFIASNLKDIVEKPEFELFGDLDSNIICEVVRAIARINLKQ